MCSLHVSGEISPIIRRYRTVENSDMVMVPRVVRRDIVEEIKWSLARQYYARVRDVKRDERSQCHGSYLNLYSSVTPDDG